MSSLFADGGNRLERRFDSETLRIEAWGANALRVRATQLSRMPEEDWALLPPAPSAPRISISGDEASIVNGAIEARVDRTGRLAFLRAGAGADAGGGEGRVLLREYQRNWDSAGTPCAIRVPGRDFTPILGGDYSLAARFEASEGEKIFGMGQYQQSRMDMKGCVLELAHRNSQSSVPFAMSNRGYGMLWNNPAIGEVVFGENRTEWRARSTKALDYWIVAGDSPARIEEAYAEATGRAPMMPEYGLGFWQCKLRYRTRGELLEAAREYKRRGLPLDVIVVDFFHWRKQGDWSYDPDSWPDPEGMARELKEMGIELMVSIWPTVEQGSSHYDEMLRLGYLTRVDRGARTTMQFCGDTLFYDATNPEARRYLWKAAKEGYFDKGVRLFWLDEAEPEFSAYDFDNYRYWAGPALRVGNAYPALHARAFYEGMREAGMEAPVNLARCAWAGSQRYGAAIWSGDILSSFAVLRNQIKAGLNMAIAGIPWWTTDIGGFFGGDVRDPSYPELLVRWFQYGAFCPVFRLHGDRLPEKPPLSPGGTEFHSGADNEVWRFGDEAYGIMRKYMLMRERLRPYLREAMRAAHERGTPPMRPLFYDFPDDPEAWDIEDEYLFGPDLLVAPVLSAGARTRDVYLPAGREWTEVATGASLGGGRRVEAAAPLDAIPLFLARGSALDPSAFS
jgi:alpha-D-xyloside xylohydrolase